MFIGVRTTLKPWKSALSSSMESLGVLRGCGAGLSSRGSASGSSVPLYSGTLNQTSNIRKNSGVHDDADQRRS